MRGEKHEKTSANFTVEGELEKGLKDMQAAREREIERERRETERQIDGGEGVTCARVALLKFKYLVREQFLGQVFDVVAVNL